MDIICCTESTTTPPYYKAIDCDCVIVTNSNKMEDLYCDLCGWTGHPKHAKYTHDDNGDEVLTCPKDCQIYDFQTELEVMNTVDVDGYKLLWYDHKPTAEYVEKELRV